MPKQGLKKLLAGLFALLILCVFALPALAEEERSSNTQEVIAQLKALQRVHIDPAWTPDIEANQRAVQAMLDAFLACSSSEKGEFTKEETDTLKAYFRTLYTVQGKDPSAVDTLFTSSGTASGSSSAASPKPSSSSSSSTSTSSSSRPASSSSSSSYSSSGASSNVSVSESTSQLESASVSSSVAPVSSAPASSSAALPPAGNTASSSNLPKATFTPQMPTGGGWNGFFTSAAFGQSLLFGLFVLIGLLFLRFLGALRSAGRPPKAALEEDLRNRELFGELYEDEIELAPHEAAFAVALKNAIATEKKASAAPVAANTSPPKPTPANNNQSKATIPDSPPPQKPVTPPAYANQAYRTTMESTTAPKPPEGAPAFHMPVSPRLEKDAPPPAPAPINKKPLGQPKTGRPKPIPFDQEDLPWLDDMDDF